MRGLLEWVGQAMCWVGGVRRIDKWAVHKALCCVLLTRHERQERRLRERERAEGERASALTAFTPEDPGASCGCFHAG